MTSTFHHATFSDLCGSFYWARPVRPHGGISEKVRRVRGTPYLFNQIYVFFLSFLSLSLAIRII